MNEISSSGLHDIRTSLNHILGYGEILLEELSDAGNDGHVSEIARVKEAALALSNAVRVNSGIRSSEISGLAAQISVELDRLLARETIENGTFDCTLRKMKTASERLAQLTGATPAVSAQKIAGLGTLGSVRSALRVSRAALTGRILIADDDAGNREILSGQLLHEGHQVEVAENGLQALQRLRDSPFDLVLMDLIMPVMDGITALERIRSDEASHELPVLMISGVDEIGSMVWCLDLGADDYILKPIDASLLRARVLSVLERKKLRDIERRKTRELESALREVEEQRAISERLLLNILPKTVAQELRESGSVSAMYFEDVTIAMTDFVHFTRSSQRLAAEELVHALHEHFTAYDTIVERYGLEKLKTVGDSYIFLAGIPERTPSHPIDVVLAAMEMIAFGKERAARDPLVSWQMRVGIHTGPVIAGVVGIHKFAFDVWGDAMNLCSRMEAASVADRVNISTKTYDRIKDFFACEGREKVRTKDGAEVEMYFVNGILPKLLDTNNGWPPSAFSRRYRMYFRKDPIAFPPPAVFDIPVSTPT